MEQSGSETPKIEVRKLVDEPEPETPLRDQLGVPYEAPNNPRANEIEAFMEKDPNTPAVEPQLPEHQLSEPKVEASAVNPIVASDALKSATGADELLTHPVPQQEDLGYIPQQFVSASKSSDSAQRQ